MSRARNNNSEKVLERPTRFVPDGRWREVMSERVDRMLLHVPIQPDRLCIACALASALCVVL